MSTTWKTTEQAALARRLVRTIDSGVLSTLSLELPGYPFGSVTPYAMTHEGRLAIYVSGIAQHTANMGADPRVCLTAVAERGLENQQAVGRVTVVGDASPVPGVEIAAVLERYLRLFPEAAGYAGTHDFALWWIEPRRVRFIGGFGKIFWVEAGDWSVPSPDWQGDEQGILDHMNTDHAEALEAIVRRHAGVACSDPRLVTVDPEGFHVRGGDELYYVPFPEPCLTPDAVRQGMIAVTKAARHG